MDKLSNLYNTAIDHLRQERYEEALVILGKVKWSYPSHSQVRWTLGLVYVMKGFPHKALHEWEGLSSNEFPLLLSNRKKVEQKLPLYEDLYHSYNRAIELVQQQVYTEPMMIFEELLLNKKEIPLPVDFYKAYLLSATLSGKKETALAEFETFPAYVRNTIEILTIKQKMSENPNNNLKEVSPTTKKFKKVVYSTGIVAAIFVGFFTTQFLGGQNTETASSQQETEEIDKYVGRTKELEELVSNLTNQKVQLETALTDQEAVVREHEELENVLTAADMNLDSLVGEAGWSIYKNGLQEFNNQHYQQAARYFEQSVSAVQNEYFSDDALFYLIQSKKMSGETDSLVGLYNQFLFAENVNFKESPYYDDILLEKVKLLATTGSVEEVTKLVMELQTNFPNDWTTAKAVETMTEIMEEKDAGN